MKKPFRIAVDFDGTIFKHRFPEVGAPVPGAFEWLQRLKEAGATLILYTMRSDEKMVMAGDEAVRQDNEKPFLSIAVECCQNYGVDFDHILMDPSQYGWTLSNKTYADVYVDDAAFGCPLMDDGGGRMMVDWARVGPELLEAVLARAS